MIHELFYQLLATLLAIKKNHFMLFLMAYEYWKVATSSKHSTVSHEITTGHPIHSTIKMLVKTYNFLNL